MSSKKFTVFWTKIAQDDFIEIIGHIALDSLANAETIFKNIKEHSIKLENFPERGRIVPELKYHNINNYQELIIHPWRLLYRIEDRKVYIIALFDSRRNLEDILLNRITRK
jgi:plasmid stabilization system protein ParE